MGFNSAFKGLIYFIVTTPSLVAFVETGVPLVPLPQLLSFIIQLRIKYSFVPKSVSNLQTMSFLEEYESITIKGRE